MFISSSTPKILKFYHGKIIFPHCRKNILFGSPLCEKIFNPRHLRYGRCAGFKCTILAFPDSDAREKWIEKINERPYLNIQISNILEKYATPEELANGADIADVLIRWILERKSTVAPQAPEPPPADLYADNPVMQEVMQYISPESWPEVDALIRDLDLEFISVTRIPK